MRFPLGSAAVASAARVIDSRTLLEPRECHQMSLKGKLAIRFLLALVVVGALLFIPAGSFGFWQAWAYLFVWFVPGFLAFAYFYKHDPELVERRLRRREKVGEQKLIMKFVYVTYVIALLLPGFDHRFGWSQGLLHPALLARLQIVGVNQLVPHIRSP